MNNFKMYEDEILDILKKYRAEEGFDSTTYSAIMQLNKHFNFYDSTNSNYTLIEDFVKWGYSEYKEKTITITQEESCFFMYIKAEFEYIFKRGGHVFVSEETPFMLSDGTSVVKGKFLKLDEYFDYLDFDGIEEGHIYNIDELLDTAEVVDSECL